MANEDRFREIASILAATEVAGGPGAESLALAESSVPPQRSDDVLDRAAERLAVLSAQEDPSPAKAAEREAARDLLLAHAGAGLAKLSQGRFDLTPDEGCAMESIIIADGSRPSFILRDGKVDSADPFIGDWGGALAASADAIAGLASAVGRIQPGGGHASSYLGTGSLIDATKGLVLTNFHVIDDAENSRGIKMRHETDRIVVEGQLEIDFAGESGSLATNRFRIVEIRLPTGFGRVFGGIDAAVCRIEPLDPGAKLPEPVKALSPDADYATGASTSLSLIGFPGPPFEDKGDKVNWLFVNEQLFGKKYGIKRLAPGRFTRRLGSHPFDAAAQRAIGHNATTFGGASGSLVVAWLDTDAPAFALHFGGETVEANYALSFAVVRDALAEIGVPFA